MSSSLDLEHLLLHKIERNELEAGDHIYSWRSWYLYSHHGIYVGDGKVIHFTGGESAGIGSIMKSSSASGPNCPKCGYEVRANGVISSCLDCFLRKGKLYRYRYGVSALEVAVKFRGVCTTVASDPAQVVIKRTNCLLEGNGFGKYNLVQNNCEDFSLYCKTGIARKPESSQSTGRSRQTKIARALIYTLKKADSRLSELECEFKQI